MNKTEIISQINKKYTSFMDYIDGLSSEDYSFRFNEKWSAGQQLEHLVLCLKPLVRLFSMSESMLEQNFIKTNRKNSSYQALKNLYLEKSGGAGKAPAKYIPEDGVPFEKHELIQNLKVLIKGLKSAVEKCNEEVLEKFLVPHPLLGEITLKEMLYNAIYHAEHHQLQVERNLLEK